MDVVIQQNLMSIVSELESLKTKFLALEIENQSLLEDLQKVTTEKQHD